MLYRRKLRVAQIWTVYSEIFDQYEGKSRSLRNRASTVFRGEADKNRGSRSATVDNKCNKRTNKCEIRKEFFPLPFKFRSVVRCDSAWKIEDNKVDGNDAVSGANGAGKYNFFFLYNIPAFFPRFRYFRKSLRSGAFPICCGRAADEISIKFWMIERVKKLLPLES